MPDQASVRNAGPALDEVIRAILRRHIQRAFDRREFTRTSLAEESGVNIHTIDTIISRDEGKHRRVAMEDGLNLAYCLGDLTVSALLGTIHYTASRRESDTLDPRRLIADLLPHVSRIAEAAADGRIDHTEMPECRDAADSMIAALTPLSSAGSQ